MINHIRTLLLNRTADDSTEIGDEYVPSSFRAKELTPRLAAIRATIFGATPDRLMLNYRLYQLMAAAHESSLAGMLTLADPRITYLLDRGRLLSPFPLAAFALTQQPLSAVADAFIGSTSQPVVDRQGLCRYRFKLTLGSSLATWYWLLNSRSPTVIHDPVTVGSRVTLDLPSGGYSVAVPNIDGASWIFDVAYQPTLSLVGVDESLTAVSETVTAVMLGGTHAARPEAPYDTLLDTWYEPQTPFDRIAAAALALALRTEALP